MARRLTFGYLLVALLGLGGGSPARAERLTSDRLDITDSMQPVPTSCLAAGRACIATRTIDTGLSVNPANITVDDKTETLWTINVGNITEQLGRLSSTGQAEKNQLGLGVAHGTKYWGLGLSIDLSRSERTVEHGASDGSVQRTNATLTSANASLKFSLRISRLQNVGIAFFGANLDHKVQRNSSNSTTTETRRYAGNYIQLGYHLQMTEVFSLAATYRPESVLFEKGLGANAESPSRGEMIQAERMGMGVGAELGQNDWFSAEADIVATRPPRNAVALEQSAIKFDEPDLTASEAGVNKPWLLRPGAGMRLALPAWLPVDRIATGVYWEPTADINGPTKLHRTWGVGRSYALFGMDLSLQFAVDETGGTRSYQINIL